jgi:hypothetical protein
MQKVHAHAHALPEMDLVADPRSPLQTRRESGRGTVFTISPEHVRDCFKKFNAVRDCFLYSLTC